jgi:hypothetical protein
MLRGCRRGPPSGSAAAGTGATGRWPAPPRTGIHRAPSPEPCGTPRRAIKRADALGLHQGAVLVMVVAAVREHLDRPPPGPAAAAGHRRDRLDQRDELGDVVAVAAGQRDRQRDTLAVGDHGMLRSGAGPVLGALLGSRTCELSAADLAQSMASAALSLASSTSCNRCHTQASCQSRSRRQHVIPDPQHYRLKPVIQPRRGRRSQDHDVSVLAGIRFGGSLPELQ